MSTYIEHSIVARSLRLFTGLLVLLSPLSTSLKAEEVATIPEGVFTVNIAAGNGVNPKISLVSLPLVGTAAANGQMVGRITNVSANSISNSTAGWTPGELSASAAPHCIRITSGVAEGRTFLISSATVNTATTVTIDAEEAGQINLASLGIVGGADGDTYEIISCDTIGSIFGSPETTGVLGGPASSVADVVQLFVKGIWREYYYNTTSSRWVWVGPEIVSANVPIRPDSAVLYSRRANAPLSLAITGRVPDTDRRATVKSSGVTFLSTNWPVDAKLSTLGIQQIPGWVSSPSPQNADIVQLLVSGIWREYYYTGTQWRWMGPDIASDNVNVPAGSAIMLKKKGVSTTSTTLTQPIPYSL